MSSSRSDGEQTKREMFEALLKEMMEWRWDRFMDGTATEFQKKLDDEIAERMRKYDEAPS